MTRIVLAGGTGLVGGELLKLLVPEHDLHLIGRRPIAEAPSSVQQHVAPTDQWSGLIEDIAAEVAISCLGTTMKIAGSKDAFAAVDLHLVRAFAEAADRGGARQIIAASSTMAVPHSNNFYLKTKGQAEQAISAIGFARVDFMRPGLLRGDRAGPFRPGESIAALLSPVTDMLLMGSLRRYRSIAASDVAKAMAALAGADTPGRFIHENDAILKLAG